MDHSVSHEKNNELIIYEAKDGSVKLSVNVKDDTVWLSQTDIASLFDVHVPAVSKHVKNIYKDGELQEKQTLSKMETVRKEGKRTVKRLVETYSLDMVLSIGYRVNSKRATQFRVWATNVLRQHLLKGYTLNKGRLQNAEQKELQEAVSLIRLAMNRKQLTGDESQGLLKVITEYAHTWFLLHQFEKSEIAEPRDQKVSRYQLTYEEATAIIRALKKNLMRSGQATEAFGEEKAGVLEKILQNFQKKAGASIEEKAANLLYALIKEKPCADGNKRIAAFLFIVYLTRSQYLSGWDGERKFNDTALVALVLLISESDPKQKNLVMKLIMNFVHG